MERQRAMRRLLVWLLALISGALVALALLPWGGGGGGVGVRAQLDFLRHKSRHAELRGFGTDNAGEVEAPAGSTGHSAVDGGSSGGGGESSGTDATQPQPELPYETRRGKNGKHIIVNKLPPIKTEPHAEGLPSYAMGGGPNRKTVRLVMWDNVRRRLIWILDEMREAAENNCSTRCILSLNREDAASADAVIFHAMTNMESFPRKPRQKPPHAKYILVSMEQPKYAKILAKPEALKQYDYLATYSQEEEFLGRPNIPMTYWPMHLMTTDAAMQPPLPFAEKDGFGTGVSVVAFVSNCKQAGAQTRHKFLTEFVEYIDVHMYGKCMHNRDEPEWPYDPAWPPLAQRRSSKIRTLARYKFYLAFENNQVRDYVSEKVLEGYFGGSVPVYRGSADVARFLPSADSFIDANDMSPKELADLIHSYVENEEAYNRFFAFKQRPVPDSFREVALRSYTHPNILCRICAEVGTGQAGATHSHSQPRSGVDNKLAAPQFLESSLLPPQPAQRARSLRLNP